MTTITRVLNLERPFPFEVQILACDPRTDRHVFLDTVGAGPLYCLCGEHEWSEDGYTAIYYPCMPYQEEAHG